MPFWSNGSVPSSTATTFSVKRLATQTSCGFAVPLMECVGQRDTLLKWASSKGEEGMTEYRREKNAASIDGLPAPLATSTG